MQHILTVFVASLIIAIQCTPVPSNSQAILLPAVQQQHYLHLPLQHTTQYHLVHPTLKLSEPLAQHVAPLTKLSNLPKDQVFFLQQPIVGSTATAYQPVLLKQGDNTDWLAIIQNFFSQLPSIGSTPSSQPDDDGDKPAEPTKSIKPTEQHHQSPYPASTTGLTTYDHRYYIISGQPQFYSTFDALRSPNSPLVSFQPLQAIVQARSSASAAAVVDDPSSEPQPSASEENVAIVSRSEPLTTSDEVPQTAFVPLETLTEIQQQKSAVNAAAGEDLQPYDVEQIVKEQITALNEARSLQSDSVPAAVANVLFEKSVVGAKQNVDDAESIAQAKPVALAVAGRGGTALASPSATAVTGDNGISVAAPRATAIAGDFEVNPDIDYDNKKN